MDTLDRNRKNRYCPCPRCGEDREDVEAVCGQCQWRPAPPDRKSAHWHYLNNGESAALLEMYEVISTLRWLSLALLGLLGQFGLHLMFHAGWAELTVGTALFGMMLFQTTRWFRS